MHEDLWWVFGPFLQPWSWRLVREAHLGRTFIRLDQGQHLLHGVAKARLVHDQSKSACLLAYELCKEHGLESETLDRLVYLANVGDLFETSTPLARTFSDPRNSGLHSWELYNYPITDTTPH